MEKDLKLEVGNDFVMGDFLLSLHNAGYEFKDYILKGSEFSITILGEDLPEDLENNLIEILNTPKVKTLIYDYIPESQDPKKQDFTLLGLDQLDWEIPKGRRTERLYLSETGKVVVRDKYSYVNKDKNVNSYTRLIEWLKEDGSVAFTKEHNIKTGKGGVTKLNRTIRQNQIDYLTDEGDDIRDLIDSLDVSMFPSQAHYDGTVDAYTDVADSIDFLVQFFDTEIRLYVVRGLPDFENKINNILNDVEVNEDVKAKLLLYVESEPTGEYPEVKRVKDSILEQIT